MKAAAPAYFIAQIICATRIVKLTVSDRLREEAQTRLFLFHINDSSVGRTSHHCQTVVDSGVDFRRYLWAIVVLFLFPLLIVDFGVKFLWVFLGNCSFVVSFGEDCGFWI
ncbi:hypothetical protein Ancab_035165 [Ancistrocladus abbreviatus]